MAVVQVKGECMVPRIAPGAWVYVDSQRSPRAGDVVLAESKNDGLIVKELHEWAGRRWLVAISGRAPLPVTPAVAILGVVTAVVHPP